MPRTAPTSAFQQAAESAGLDCRAGLGAIAQQDRSQIKVAAQRLPISNNYWRGLAVTHDIRWKQRFDNFQRALHQLTLAIELTKQRPLSDLEQLNL